MPCAAPEIYIYILYSVLYTSDVAWCDAEHDLDEIIIPFIDWLASSRAHRYRYT